MLYLSWVMNIIITYKETEKLDSQPFIFNHDRKHLFFHVWLMVGWLLSFSRKFFTFCYKWILNHLTLFFLEKHKLHILWLLRLYLKRFDYCFEKFSLEPPIPVSIEKEWVFLFQEVSSVFCCSLLFSSLGFSSYFICIFEGHVMDQTVFMNHDIAWHDILLYFYYSNSRVKKSLAPK